MRASDERNKKAIIKREKTKMIRYDENSVRQNFFS
jgi:hypothetical protein